MNCYYCGTLLEDGQTVCSRCKKENKEIVIDFDALDLVNRIPRVEPKPVEPKPVEVKPVEVNPVEVKPVEVKPVEVKPVEAEAEKTIIQPQNESLPAEKETPPVEKEEAAFEKPRETEKQSKTEKQKAPASKTPKKVVVKIKPKNKH